MLIVDNLLDEVFSYLFGETVSRFRKIRSEKKARDEIKYVIENEKENGYYDALDRILSSSCLLQDYASSLYAGSDGFDFEERLQKLGEQLHLTDMERAHVFPVVRRVCGILKRARENQLGDDTKYIKGVIDNSTRILIDKMDELGDKLNTPKRIPLSAYPSHRIPGRGYGPLITRKIIPMNQGDYQNESNKLPSPIEYLKKEKRILLLSDAGFGKTFTLYQLYYEAEEERFYTLFYRLKEIAGDNALVALAEGKVDVENPTGDDLVILLDGYDEMLEENAQNRLARIVQQIIQRYPHIRIAISSRANADYGLLEEIDFVPYRIKPLNQTDVEAYLDENEIDRGAFFEQVEMQRLGSLCQNAFYLSEMVILWHQKGALPSSSELMDSIVTERIAKDSGKYAYTSTQMERHIRDTRYRFERIALIMQCMHRDYLTEEELLRVAGDRDSAVLEYHGLWVRGSESKWRFAHNNFREYFAAVALSRKSLDEIKGFISCGTDNPSIRASWNNTLSYLIPLYKKSDLQDWIVEIQPELIALFETDRFTERQRADLYIQLMECLKKNNRWLETEYTYRKKLALFSSSSEAAKYILTELQSDVSIRQKQNLLRCLRFFVSFYEYEEDIVKTVFGIADDSNHPDYFRAEALRVMESQSKIFADYAQAVSRILDSASDESVRYEALLFLEASGTVERYFDAVSNEFKRCTKRFPTLISLRIAIERIICNITEEASSYALLSYFRENLAHIHGSFEDDAFIHCCEVGAKNYSGGKDRILQCLIDIVKTGYLLISHEKYHAIKNYMRNTSTADVFLDAIISKRIAYIRSYVLLDLMCDEMVCSMLNYLRLGKTSIPELKAIVNQFPYKNPWQMKLIESIHYQTGERIEVQPPVDYQAKQAREDQSFFDALFDERAFSELGARVCAIIGTDTPISKSLSHSGSDKLQRIYEDKALSDWYYLIKTRVPDDSQLTFGEYKKAIEDWDEFRFDAVEGFLQNHGDSIVISAQEREWLSQFAQKTLARFDIKAAITIDKGRASYPAMLCLCLSVMQMIDMECDRDLAIQLLSVPSPILKSGSPNQLPTYAVKWLDEPTITKTIISNIQAGGLNAYTSPSYTHYCLEHGITECKQEIIAYMLDSEKNDGFVYAETEYIAKLFGIETLLSEVLPHCKEARLLECIVTQVPFGVKSDELDHLLWDFYRKTKYGKWLKFLINRNDVNALAEYCKLAKDCMSLPKMGQNVSASEVSDAIRTVYKIECLEPLIDLLKLSCEAGFSDKTEAGFGLNNACWEAISNIAKTDFFPTIEALGANKQSGNSEFEERVGDLIQRLKALKEYSNDVAMSFDCALMLTK